MILLVAWSFPLQFFYAQGSSIEVSDLESRLDAELEGEKSPSGEKVPMENQWDVYGFFQNRNFFSANRYADMMTLRNEARANVNLRYGNKFQYVKVAGDVYAYPSAASNDLDDGRAELREMYFSAGDVLVFLIGKKAYQWGSADVFNVVNYTDQADQRKLFATDKDDRYLGVYSASLKYIFGEFSVETLAIPYFAAPLLPSQEWEIRMDPYSTPFGALPVQINRSGYVASGWRNASYAARSGGTLGNFDFHLAYFNGISRSFLFAPSLEVVTPGSAQLNMDPVFSRVQSAGLDFAFTWDKLSVRAESSYTNDMPAVEKMDDKTLSSVNPMILIIPGKYTMGKTEREQYLSYVVGVDYNLWGNNGRVLAEWMEGYYLFNKEKYSELLLNRLLLFRVEDKWLNERLITELGTIIRPVDKSPGYGVLYKLGWDFKNGLTMETEGYFFFSADDAFFDMLEYKDMVAISAKMTF